MSYPGAFPTAEAAAVPVVNTIQAVRAPIVSVPTLSDGQLNIGAVEVVPTTPIMEQPGLAPSATPTAPRRVLAKPLAPRQPSPALLSPQMLSPVKGLGQYAQITPQQAQNLLKQLASGVSSSAGGLSLSPQRAQLQQMLPPAAGGVVHSSHMLRGGGAGGGGGRGSKPIMPKPSSSSSSEVRAFTATPLDQLQQQAFSTHPLQPRVRAPVAVLPHGVHASDPDELDELMHSSHPLPSHPPHSHQPTVTKTRKPCNCKNSQCLKLYCDCFANGEFCRDGCNCHHCKNNMDHAEDRARAVKICLDRNPNAFKPKVGHNRSIGGDERRHIKGCNCKRSGCLKNYCECFEAKIPCSALCRCVGCKNVAEKPENKSLMHLADAADIRTQQQRAATSHFMEQLEASSMRPQPTTRSGQRLPFSFINKEVSKATCLCLLEEASHAEMNGKSPVEVERAVLEEFGRCMTQIINSTQTGECVRV